MKSAQRRIFSLKWKALLLTSLVLIAVTLAISLLSYINLTVQFDRHRQTLQEGYKRETQALIEQSLERLRQLAGTVPSLPGMQPGLARSDPELIRQAMEPQWPVLQFDWGIDLLAFYDTQNRLLSWEPGDEQIFDVRQLLNMPEVLTWIAEVNIEEKPVLALSCDATFTCMQYAVVPMLVEGRSVGVVLVGSSLANVLLSLNRVSGNDIGLMVRDPSATQRSTAGDEVGAALPIRAWGVWLVAMTNKTRNYAVLTQAAASASLSQVSQGVRFEVAGRSFAIRLLKPLSEELDFHSSSEIFLVVVADITETLAEIRSATQEIVVVGGLGWVLSEVLLLIILWTPMSRLKLTADNLPLLAQRQFDAVRTAILGHYRRHLLDDEIDILDDTTIALADRLERLEAQVAERTRSLSQRMEELARERDFIANLLDTAQVMIVTQDQRGRIVMTNAFTRSITGYQEADLIGRDFVGALLAEGALDLTQRLGNELSSKRLRQLHHESLVTCKDGGLRNITWYHSRLKSHLPGDPVVLSVGLDITERLGAESRLAWLSDHDALTGLVNRRRFQEELDMVLNLARRHQRSGALLVIDLDQFKYINDTSGHHSGDALLKAVSKALVNQEIAADEVARLGSDEFALLVREATREQAVQMARRISQELSGISLAVKGQRISISASIGMVIFPNHGDNVVDLLACADLAMHQAKEQGHGNWYVYAEDDKTLEQIRNRVYWKDKVSYALQQDRFVLYYQPIMEIATRQISHYEVLLRMREEDGGVIGPAHFIDAAERSGMIHAVDRMVISKAIQALAQMHRAGHNVAFAINLSGHAFNDPDLLGHLRQELRNTQIDTSKVIFEITETAAVSDFAVANSLMLAIKELGCRFALDDFGIGFSSFYYLKHLPVDYLKIDGSFIRQLADSLDDQIIVQAMSQAASGFGKKTVAEFVETSETLELLQEFNIDYAQGYLISKPLAAEQLFDNLIPQQQLA